MLINTENIVFIGELGRLKARLKARFKAGEFDNPTLTSQVHIWNQLIQHFQRYKNYNYQGIKNSPTLAQIVHRLCKID